jgi:putative redox protein
MREQVRPPQHVDLQWDDQSRFHVKSPSGVTAVLDSQRQIGLSPMEALLAALCGCVGTDLVSILRKMRVDFSAVTISASGEQNPELPKYYKRIALRFLVKGKVPLHRVEHAVELSLQTYCSVFHSLRKDIDISHTIEIQEP